MKNVEEKPSELQSELQRCLYATTKSTYNYWSLESLGQKKDLHKEAPKNNSMGVGLQKML